MVLRALQDPHSEQIIYVLPILGIWRRHSNHILAEHSIILSCYERFVAIWHSKVSIVMITVSKWILSLVWTCSFLYKKARDRFGTQRGLSMSFFEHSVAGKHVLEWIKTLDAHEEKMLRDIESNFSQWWLRHSALTQVCLIDLHRYHPSYKPVRQLLWYDAFVTRVLYAFSSPI